MDIDDYKMVRLTWLDAQESCTGWSDWEEMTSSSLATCQEVGWLIVDNDEKVVVMRSWHAEEEQGGACIAIPKSWVIKVQELGIIEEDFEWEWDD